MMFTLWQRVDIRTALVMEHLEAACENARRTGNDEGIKRTARRFDTTDEFMIIEARRRGWLSWP